MTKHYRGTAPYRVSLAQLLLSVSVLISMPASSQNTPPPPSAEDQQRMREAQERYNAMPDTKGTGPFAAL
ncbi:MAG TPA: hypothetical protein VFS24_00020, partial [Steroidobacteraceae bacterium]|nr:hypothetical protein [Steroidobacteraceae bacterium]